MNGWVGGWTKLISVKLFSAHYQEAMLLVEGTQSFTTDYVTKLPMKTLSSSARRAKTPTSQVWGKGQV